MDRDRTLKRLNKEREYEDKLAQDLDTYFCHCLNDIEDITESERQKIDSSLKIIIRDSEKHRAYFDIMIQKVMEHGKDDY